MRYPIEFSATAHSLEAGWLRLHGLKGFAMMVGIGSVFPVTPVAAAAWRKRFLKPYLLQIHLNPNPPASTTLFSVASQPNTACSA